MLSPQKKMTINLISARLSKSIHLIQSWKFHSLKKKKRKKKTRKMNKIINYKKIKQEQTLIPKSIRLACD